MTDREKLIDIILHTPCVAVSSRTAAGHIADHLIANGVTFHVRKTENSMCLFCNSSMSSDAPDGSQVLVCFDCAGHEGKEMIVGDDEWCPNYNGIA